MREIRFLMISVITMSLVLGCSGPQRRHQVQFVPRDIQAELPTEGYAKAGAWVYMTRMGREAETLQMSKGIVSTMPGTLGLSFFFSIAKTDLNLEYQNDDYLYYVAPITSVSAYSMGSLVIGRNDEVGVRVSRRDGAREWYIDNSAFNDCPAGTVVWSRPIEDADEVKLTLKKVVLPVKDSNIRFVTFDGYSSNTLHFTYREIDNDYEITKHFDFQKTDNIPAFVQIRGAELEIFDASSEGIEYRAVKGFNGATVTPR